MNNEIKILIDNAVDISRKIESIKNECYNKRRKNKGNFNFFSAIVSGKHSREHIEMYHSNVIAYFLNPNGEHDCDDIFLKEFLEFLKVEKEIIIPESNIIKSFTCERERCIDSGRSIDISLEYKNDWIIFIENKVRSGELQNQMSDYCIFANNNFNNRIGIFLSTEGYVPQSIRNANFEKSIQVFNLSYADIIQWLENCLKKEEFINVSKIKDAILQYITIIKKTINTMEDIEMKKTVEYFTANEKFSNLIELYRNKDVLNRAIDESVKEIRKNFLSAISSKFNVNDSFNEFAIVKNNIQKNGNRFEIEIKIREKIFLLAIEQSFPFYDDGGQGIWYGIYKIPKQTIHFQLGLESDYWEGLKYNFDNQEINDFTDATNTFNSTIILLENYRNIDQWNEIVNQCEQKIKQILIDKKEIILMG